MNEEQDPMAGASREEMISALFANLVVQQANMAFIFLGRVPHPETGEIVQDFESAQFFIDQLEMIEAKTKGNLDSRESNLLQQSLMSVRMAFVEATDEKGPSPAASKVAPSPIEQKAPEPAPAAPASVESSPAGSDDESRKKYSKKY